MRQLLRLGAGNDGEELRVSIAKKEELVLSPPLLHSPMIRHGRAARAGMAAEDDARCLISCPRTSSRKGTTSGHRRRATKIMGAVDADRAVLAGVIDLKDPCDRKPVLPCHRRRPGLAFVYTP